MRKGARHILVLLVLTASLSAVPNLLDKNQGGTEWVVLLHGLGRSGRSLALLAPGRGRVVMLPPPNQGSELADLLKRSVLFKKFMAPAGLELGTDMDSVPRK